MSIVVMVHMDTDPESRIDIQQELSNLGEYFVLHLGDATVFLSRKQVNQISMVTTQVLAKSPMEIRTADEILMDEREVEEDDVPF